MVAVEFLHFLHIYKSKKLPELLTLTIATNYRYQINSTYTGTRIHTDTVQQINAFLPTLREDVSQRMGFEETFKPRCMRQRQNNSLRQLQALGSREMGARWNGEEKQKERSQQETLLQRLQFI